MLGGEPDTVLQAGDVIAVSGPRDTLVQLSNAAREVEDRELLSVPVESVDVLVTRKAFDGRQLVELAREPFARGVHLTSIRRGSAGVAIPVLAQTELHRGDIVRIAGTKTHTDRVVAALGYADRPTSVTNMVLVGLGICIGGLIGSLIVPIEGIPITLGTSGGALIAGILLGWCRTVDPRLGNVPQPTLWFMNSVGLNTFIAVIGITSGPTFVAGLQQAGFVPNFRSILALLPKNTIGVYSYSKYVGAIGWRLGVIAIHPDNVFTYIAYTSIDLFEIHTALITCFFVALGSGGETFQKSTLRLSGRNAEPLARELDEAAGAAPAPAREPGSAPVAIDDPLRVHAFSLLGGLSDERPAHAI